MPNGNENVENVRAVDEPLPPGRLWTPVVGEQLRGTLQLQTKLTEFGRAAIEQQTVSILGKTIPPEHSQGSETGLALGYVQSGKTLSFTCVAALASDNRFPLIIVITGTSIPLFLQSVRRLRTDLRIENPESHAWRWQFFQNPNVRQNHLTRIRDILAEWQEPRVEDKRTCLLAVMKNHRHLNHLVDLIESLNLKNVPTLVIDDEADQAGLNTMVNQNEESRTYQRLLNLRNALPNHSLLQYTATPQAPLLINIIDVLSPRFVEVLEPGRGYVGLTDFFQFNRALVRLIPDDEIPSPDNPLNGAPESLRNALRLFLMGVAAGLILHSPERNRSMLVHPSRLQERHANYFQWVSAVRSDWVRLLGDENDPDRAALLNDFRGAHADLGTTYPNLPPFEQIERVLWQTINRTRVWEVNARLGRTPDVVWQSDYAHILIGGQAMDRGFTVEGLTVTYMPRGRGVGNADTIQQRARFLGYKRSYLGLCRVFLESEVQNVCTAYVDHEENLRDQLRQHAAAGRSPADWRRAFFLDSTLKPTRRSVLDSSKPQWRRTTESYRCRSCSCGRHMDASRHGRGYAGAGPTHMKVLEIAKAFGSLPLPQPSSPSSCSFSALSLEIDSPHKLAKDEGGCPCLLVATGSAAKTQTRVPLVLENLAVLFDLRCQVSSPKAPTQTGTFTVLKCVAADLMVRSYFLSLLKGISAAIGRASDRVQVAAVIEDLVELFRSLGNIPKKEIQGLWGELFLIHQAKDPITLASAWRSEIGDCYDFNKGDERVEVKTTSMRARHHRFSLEQLSPPFGTRLVVASIKVQTSGAGLSVFDLLDAIRQKTAQHPQLHMRMTRQIHETLGNGWQSARNLRFDLEAAVESLLFFDGAQIPKISSPLPGGVSQVSFVFDLEAVAPIRSKARAGSGPLFSSLSFAK